MHSEVYQSLQKRIQNLKRRYLPPTKPNGIYTEPEQDQLRALRMLAHAEIEQFLENHSEILANDIQRELKNQNRKPTPLQVWASKAANQAALAKSKNNGVNEDSIRSLFDPFGFSEEDYDSISSIFLDRLTTFGKHRGDVAHRSAIGATHQLNRTREEKFLNEIMDYLQDFDRLLIKKRLDGFGL